jgi:hypothetical protein
MSAMNEEQVRDLIRERADGNVAAWAKSHGFTPQYAGDVLSGRRKPGNKILTALGLAKDIAYVPKEKLT